MFGKAPPLILRVLLSLAIVLLIVGALSVRSCNEARTAKTEATLSRNQTGAAIESGKDAVNTVGNSQANEAATRAAIKEGTDAIDNATGGDSNAAADRAACRMRSYANRPECVALLGPAAQ